MLNEFHTPCVEFVKQITLESPLFRSSIHIGIGEKEDLRARHCSPNPTHCMLSTYGTWTTGIVQNSVSYAHSFHQMRKTRSFGQPLLFTCHTRSASVHTDSPEPREASWWCCNECSIPFFIMHQFSKPRRPDSTKNVSSKKLFFLCPSICKERRKMSVKHR